ncbi:MAG: nucleoside 2-deoxyribosyltransferase [Candidatus Nanohaloarchaea archaeon]|nr:nucleoside 2-deoxyribosyltransferase [Candidatus Nanohaloarchaea archaeon]
MDIYFCGSIRGGRDDTSLYQQIIQLLQQHGTVLSEHIGDENVEDDGEQGMTEDEIHSRDLDWLQQADAIVAEVTTPSLGVGYEIAKAEEWGIPILALFRPGSSHALSAMVRGSDGTRVHEYSDIDELAQPISDFLDQA